MSTPSSTDYIPINCTFHDRLEDYAVRGALIPVTFIQDGVAVTKTVRIADVFAKGEADYALLKSEQGTEDLIRLDKLLSVNGFEMPVAC